MTKTAELALRGRMRTKPYTCCIKSPAQTAQPRRAPAHPVPAASGVSSVLLFTVGQASSIATENGDFSELLFMTPDVPVSFFSSSFECMYWTSGFEKSSVTRCLKLSTLQNCPLPDVF